MFHVPRTVGFEYHMGSVVLFSPWRIAFRVEPISVCVANDTPRLVHLFVVVRTGGCGPFHSTIRLSVQRHDQIVALLRRGWSSILGAAVQLR
jgi:hypothetical protein